MKHILPTILFAALCAPAWGQEVQKCCNNSSSTFLLGNMNYARHSQCLYAPGDFTGAEAGSITRLYYRYGVSGIALGNTLEQVTISMQQTSATSFTGVQFLTGLQTVLGPAQVQIEPGISGDWFSIDLDTPFEYDPSLSLVVDINFAHSTNSSFGTMSESGTTGRKIMSSSTTDLSGESWTTLQDIGFDLLSTGMAERMPAVTALFPNPAQAASELRLAAPLPGPVELLVADLTGRTVQERQLPTGTTKASVDMQDLPPGIYLVQLRDEAGRVQARRLVRQ